MTLTELEQKIAAERQKVEDKKIEQYPTYEKMRKEFDDVYNASKESIALLCSEFGIPEPYIDWDCNFGMVVQFTIHKSFPEKQQK